MIQLGDNHVDVVSEALGTFTVQIREDLLSDKQVNHGFSEAQIRRMTARNSDQSSSINID
ncbi:MAG: hypothetical protein ACWA5X_05980 [bacterium]